MSGGLIWATTAPSTNSTNEWTTDCGWITTSICSGVRPNSQRHSMISSALFIIVAESTVILGPMVQLGCAKASSTVTCVNWSLDRWRKGPPLAVKTTRAISSRRPAWTA